MHELVDVVVVATSKIVLFFCADGYEEKMNTYGRTYIIYVCVSIEFIDYNLYVVKAGE